MEKYVLGKYRHESHEFKKIKTRIKLLMLLLAERIQTFAGAYETYPFISIVIYFVQCAVGHISDNTVEPTDAG